MLINYWMLLAGFTMTEESAMLLRYLLIPLAFVLALIFAVAKVGIYGNEKKPPEEPGADGIIPVPQSILEPPLSQIIERAGYAYDATQDLFYSIRNAWQRKYGYCQLYDEACSPLTLILDFEPIRFNYDNRRWLIELWKGQYGMTTGCEVGVYQTDGPDLDVPGVFNGTFYDSVSDEEQLNISYTLYKNKKPLFKRADRHWWLTGFILGEFTEPNELTMDVSITLRDQPMCDAFVKALKKAGYLSQEIKVRDNTVSLFYDKPRMPQPLTRVPLTDWAAQRKNQLLCEKYQQLTAGYRTAPEKLIALQTASPEMYTALLDFGRPQQVYRQYDTISEYLNRDQ